MFPHRIIFVRHGETAYNAENRLQGQRDIPLRGRGRDQARAVGLALSARIGDEIDRLEAAQAFVASPLARARETMELARARDGSPAERLSHRRRAEGNRLWRLGGLDLAGSGGARPKSGEGAPGRQMGLRSAARRKLRDAGGSRAPFLAALAADAFVVSHGGVARAFMTLLAGVPGEAAANAPIVQGRALVFDKGRCGWIE